MIAKVMTRARTVTLVPALALAIAGAGMFGAFRPVTAQSEPPSSAPSDRHGFLGVMLQDLDRGLRDSYDYTGTGAIVTAVTDGSPAEKVGLKEGDIITRFEDRQVNDADQLTDMVRAASPGSLAGIWVWRDGKETFLGRAEIADRRNRAFSEVAPAPRVPRAPRAPQAPRAPRAMRVVPPDPDVRRDVVRLIPGRGRLGVETHDLDQELGSYFSAPGGKGVLVLRVIDDTPAARAGVKAGDVIVAVAGKDIEDTEDLRRALRDREKGPVDLKIVRKGATQTLRPELEDASRRIGFSLDDDEDWMGFMDESGPVWGWHGRGWDKEKMKGKSGHGMRMFHFDDLSDEEREELEDELEELREDMQELKRELEGMRRSRDR